MKILLVEDCPSQRATYVRFLSSFGHAVTTATDGVDALTLLEEKTDEHWDVLVSDYNMPRMNGVDLILEVVTRKISFQKVILFSGTVSDCPDFKSLKENFAGGHWFHFANKDDGIEKLNSIVTSLSRAKS